MVTVAIIDFAHSGTTMLAGICHILGVPMVGADYKPHKMEDLEVARAIRDEGRFARLVEQRNGQHEAWGFKMAGAWKFPNSLAHLREPVYLAIYKDPVSVTARRFGLSTTAKLANTLEQMKRNFSASGTRLDADRRKALQWLGDNTLLRGRGIAWLEGGWRYA